MDWIDEKMEQFRSCIRNLPVKKALLSYLCIAAVIAFLMSSATIRICEKWTEILAERQNVNMDRAYTREALFFYYKQSAAGITDREETILILLQEMVRWCPYVYTVLTMMAAGSLFYRKRLQKPFGILEDAVEKVGKKELDFTVAYESEDEMGKLCASFEEMRQNLEENQKEMWNLVEEQKKLNAAFAHDLRTPLTVIRGYSDFLVRYLPKGKISQEKLKDTLRLLSEQAERLERFSGTMKSLRSVDEIPFAPTGKRKQELEMRIQGMVDALNVAKEVKKGRNYLIFAEGTRSKNGNQTGTFKGGSFKAATKAQCPIVPVALIDSFKPFDSSTIKPVTVQVHFLKPIEYEEYKDMKTTEIAALVQERVQHTIDENIR